VAVGKRIAEKAKGLGIQAVRSTVRLQVTEVKRLAARREKPPQF